MIKIFKKFWYLLIQIFLTFFCVFSYYTKIKKKINFKNLSEQKIKKILSNKKISNLWIKFKKKQKKIYFASNAGGVNIKDQKLFFFLISFYKPKKILEIGTHLGHSLNSMACAKSYNNLKNTSIDTVDIYDVNKINRYVNNNKIFSPKKILIKNKVFNKIKFIKSGSDNFFNKNKINYDLIFVDGNHTINQVLKDIINSLNCLNENGIIVLHDYYEINSFKDLFSKIYGPFFALKIIKNKLKSLRIIKLSKIGDLLKNDTTLVILNSK